MFSAGILLFMRFSILFTHTFIFSSKSYIPIFKLKTLFVHINNHGVQPLLNDKIVNISYFYPSDEDKNILISK